jgi:hypothetical protein
MMEKYKDVWKRSAKETRFANKVRREIQAGGKPKKAEIYCTCHKGEGVEASVHLH